jgi:hypothetical protein
MKRRGNMAMTKYPLAKIIVMLVVSFRIGGCVQSVTNSGYARAGHVIVIGI